MSESPLGRRIDAEVLSKRGEAIRDIEDRRERLARRAAFWVVTACELLFVCFVVGYSLGPARLLPVEIIAGAILSFAAGAVLCFPIVRRRLEAGAEKLFTVKEGRHQRRVAAFADHLTVDMEIIVAIDRVQREPDRVILEYLDVGRAEPAIRFLQGKSDALDGIAAAANKLLVTVDARRPAE